MSGMDKEHTAPANGYGAYFRQEQWETYAYEVQQEIKKHL